MIVPSTSLNFDIRWRTRDLAVHESATRSHYKNLIGDLPAARVGTLNINVSSLAEVSLHSYIPGVPGENHNLFLALLSTPVYNSPELSGDNDLILSLFGWHNEKIR